MTDEVDVVKPPVKIERVPLWTVEVFRAGKWEHLDRRTVGMTVTLHDTPLLYVDGIGVQRPWRVSRDGEVVLTVIE